MKLVDVERATKNIDALTLTNYQARHEDKVFKRKGC